MCASEKKQEHMRKMEKDGKYSENEKRDEGDIRRHWKDKVTNGASKTQTRTAEDMAVYTEAFTPLFDSRKLM